PAWSKKSATASTAITPNDTTPSRNQRRLVILPPPLSPIGIVARVLEVASAAGAKLAQILEVSIQHIAITTTYAVSLGKVLQTVDCPVQLSGIEFAPSPSIFEFPKVSGNFVEVLCLMTIET